MAVLKHVAGQGAVVCSRREGSGCMAGEAQPAAARGSGMRDLIRSVPEQPAPASTGRDGGRGALTLLPLVGKVAKAAGIAAGVVLLVVAAVSGAILRRARAGGWWGLSAGAQGGACAGGHPGGACPAANWRRGMAPPGCRRRGRPSGPARVLARGRRAAPTLEAGAGCDAAIAGGHGHSPPSTWRRRSLRSRRAPRAGSAETPWWLGCCAGAG